MRQIGTLPEEQALRFADYLLTLGISSRVEETADGCVLWSHQEDQLDQAREELRRFLEQPDAALYLEARRKAEEVRRERRRVELEHARKTIDLRNRYRGTGSILGPATRALLIASLVVFAYNWFGPPIQGRSLYDWLVFTDWFRDGSDAGLEPVRQGQIWRLLSPILVHFGPIHLLFNMYMLVRIGGPIEDRRGTGEFLALILLTGLISNFAQFALPDAFTIPSARTGGGPFGGMSGVIYGLFGYAWFRGKYDPGSGLMLHPQTVVILLVWLVLCALNLLGPIANTAHAVGLMVGVTFSTVSMWRDGVFR